MNGARDLACRRVWAARGLERTLAPQSRACARSRSSCLLWSLRRVASDWEPPFAVAALARGSALLSLASFIARACCNCARSIGIFCAGVCGSFSKDWARLMLAFLQVWIAAGRTDMRRGMQGLALQVQESSRMYRNGRSTLPFVLAGYGRQARGWKP